MFLSDHFYYGSGFLYYSNLACTHCWRCYFKSIQCSGLNKHHNIKTTCLILCRSPSYCQNSSEALKMGSSKLWGGASMDWIWSQLRCSVGLRSRHFWRPRQHLELCHVLKPFLNSVCSVAGALSCWKRLQRTLLTSMLYMVCNSL